MDVRLPDGTILRNVPEGTTKAQIMAKLGQAPQAAAQEGPEEPGMLSQLGRQVGLTARAPVSAALSIPAAVGDLVTGGRSTPAVQRVLDAIFPSPQNGTERVAQDIAGAMAGGAGLAQATKTGATILPQVLAAAGGAGGAGVTREMGAGPLGQIAASIAGGVVAPSAAVAAGEGTKAALRTAKGLVEPFTEQGRRTIAARTMQGAASDPKAAAANIQSAPEYVPGQQPLTAELAQDSGLSSLQKTLRNRNPAEFADRAAVQDAARQSHLDRVFGKSVRSMEADRDAVTGPMRNAALSQPKEVNLAPINTLTESIMKSGAGKREGVEQAMKWVRSRVEGETDPRRLDAVRQDINDVIAGKMDRDPEKAVYKLAAKELAAVRGRLVDAIDKAAPGYRGYLQKYGDLSGPIEKQRLGQDLIASATNNTTERLSTPKLANLMANRADDIGKTMGAQESDALYRVLQDMRRSAAPEAAMRTPGSDTTQNLIGANLLRSTGITPGPFGRMAAGLMGRVYGPMEDQTQGLLLRAMMDPQEGAGLLSMQIAKDPMLAEELRRRLLGLPAAGLLGGAVAQ
jgi:hypothetical protein